MSSSCVVVGAGICGLTAAILLSRKYDRVTLIEQSDHCGGLLQSVQDEQGNEYDQGTHIPEKTGVKVIDDILFGDQEYIDSRWQKISALRTGNYFNGKWDFNTQTIDARKLPLNLYHQGVGELMTRDSDSISDNIKEYLEQTLGPVFFNQLALPVIKKLYGNDVEPINLTRQTGINYFGAGRIIAFSSELTHVLKKHPSFDAKLGFHHQTEYEDQLLKMGVEPTEYLYPSEGRSAQLWVDDLLQRAIKADVRIITSENISSIKHSNGKIASVSLSASDEELPCDLLFWSAPPVFALKAAGLEVQSDNVEFRTANILHFNLDKAALNTTCQYLWNWDEVSPIFRITLYQNLRTNGAYQVTAEYLSNREDAACYTLEQGLADLKKMNLLSSDTQVLSGFQQVIHNTFPVPTFDFKRSTERNFNALNNSFHNIIISGRFSGSCWLQSDVLKQMYRDIEAID
ncbi:NAD(P)-binding protein [Shewanella woodyi]|uniref:NAD(P)-binding protein n=1 Tax=Shewanella woodyi TaxID=60961 RepID=UPI00374872DE